MSKIADVIVVSGLPRSGTSLMMQMLAAGGVEVLTDGERQADEDNPRGYFELEQVKKIKLDASWVPGARGKAIKMISQLMYGLPTTERCRVVLMERSLDEVLSSQEKMLKRLGRPAVAREIITPAFQVQVDRFNNWIVQQQNLVFLRVEYAKLVADPAAAASRINAFLGGGLDEAKMAAAVEPALYRNRKPN